MLSRIFCIILAVFYSVEAFAAGKTVNWYASLVHALGINDEHLAHTLVPLCSSLLVLALLILGGLKFRSHINNLGDNIIPSRSFGLGTAIEMVMEFLYSLCQGIIGDKHFKPYVPLLSTLFLYILLSNLTGMVPGFPPASESLSNNLAMGLSVFLVYNFAGIKEHGGSYINQFLGPVLLLAPLLLIIETVGHVARPVSLSLRLMGNIFGDHLVVGTLLSFPIINLALPGLFLFFGLLVACIQSFVFTLLSGIYISMAVSHDH